MSTIVFVIACMLVIPTFSSAQQNELAAEIRELRTTA